MRTLHHKKLAHGAINYLNNIFNLSISPGQISEIWHKAIIIPNINPARTTTLARTSAQLVYCAQRPKCWKNSCCKKYTSLTTLLNMAFSRNTRHAVQCQRSPQTLLPASQEKNLLTKQYSSHSIRQLHLTMWTINNCLIVFSTPTYRQQSIAGSTTICRTDKPKFIFGNKNLKAER